jgi:hypothetical protein
MYTVRVTPYIAFELHCSNEGLSAKDGDLYTALFPFIEKQFAPGTYQVNEVALKELHSWADFGYYCATTDDYREVGRVSAFRAFLKQTTKLQQEVTA